MKDVTIYTDGACSGNPGRGGWGAILVHAGREKEMRGGFRWTTNNRMEILASIEGMKALKEPCRVDLVTDSKYLVDAMTKGWVKKWKSKGWMRTSKEKAKNADLWERLLVESERHELKWTWVRGHDGHVMNERADALAVEARDELATQEADFGFEKEQAFKSE